MASGHDSLVVVGAGPFDRWQRAGCKSFLKFSERPLDTAGEGFKIKLRFPPDPASYQPGSIQRGKLEMRLPRFLRTGPRVVLHNGPDALRWMRKLRSPRVT